MHKAIVFNEDDVIFTERPDVYTLRSALTKTLERGGAVTLPLVPFSSRESAQASVAALARSLKTNYGFRANGKVFTAWLFKG